MLDQKYMESHCHKAPTPIENIKLSTEVADHSHEYLQVVIGLQGKAEFDINGCCSNIIPGQGCIITPDSNHAYGSVKEPSNILVLNLTPDTETNYSAIIRMCDLASKDCYFGLDTKTTQLIRMLANEVYSNPHDNLLCQACNHTIIALLKNHTLSFQAPSGRLNIESIDSYIEQHIQNKISIAQLAGSVFLSESQFHKQFKKLTGNTPHQYVLVKRVEYAKFLIETTEANLSHISDLAGFSGQSSFTHTFTKYEGISPSNYKTRYC